MANLGFFAIAAPLLTAIAGPVASYFTTGQQEAEARKDALKAATQQAKVAAQQLQLQSQMQEQAIAAQLYSEQIKAQNTRNTLILVGVMGGAAVIVGALVYRGIRKRRANPIRRRRRR